MTREELDTLWNRSVNQSIKAGDSYARYRYAEYVAAAEREACAKIADSVDNYANPMTARDCADAIRARGSK
jgi:hypothetical protein